MGRRVDWGGVFFKKTSEHNKMLAVAFFLAALAAVGVFTAPSPTDGLCSSYSAVSGISCHEAVSIATAKYPGAVRMVFPKDSFDTGDGVRNIWIADVLLDAPMMLGANATSDIRAGIDRATGNVLFLTRGTA